MKYLLIILVLIFWMPVFAQDFSKPWVIMENDTISQPVWGMGLSLSSFGTGIFVFNQIHKNFRVKASINYIFYNYSLNKLIPDLEGEAKLKLGGIGLFADWHICKFVYLSTGASTNFNKIDINGQMANSIMFGDIEMTPEDIGKVGIKVEPSWAISPYIGIGAGRKISYKRNFGFSFEIGTFFQGPPVVNLSATGMLTPTASKEQEDIIENNIKSIDFWPKVAVNITYKLK